MNRVALGEMLSHGVETKAHLTRAEIEPQKGGKLYVIGFSWRDRAGRERTVDREVISQELWNRLTSRNLIIVWDTSIKYLENDKISRAILLWDADAKLGHELTGIYVSIFAAMLGAVILALKFRNAYRRPEAGLAQPSRSSEPRNAHNNRTPESRLVHNAIMDRGREG